MQPLDHQQGNQGCPNLDAKGILALPYEGFDLQVLLQRLEEEFDFPPVPVDLTYGARREPEVIGEKNDIFSCFRVLCRDPAERFRISLLHPRSGKTDDLVGKNMLVSGQRSDFLHGIDAVVLHPGDEEDALIRPGPKLAEVHVPPVQGHDGAGLEDKLLRHAAVVGLRLRDGDEGGHVVVVIQQYMDLYTALGPPEFRPGKERQAEADGRGIKGQQLVLETELLLPASHGARGAKMIRQPPEQLLEKFRFAMIVCIGEGGSSGRLLYPQVNEFSITAAESVDDLPERIRSSQMTEEHGDELRLRAESLGVTFSAPFGDQVVKVHCCENLRKYLTEQARRL
ncbi:hypothetical protein SDC9_88068 [bioreactor metagenome]|uniref:Uncharacterized protein n=1 Tax=bioreactor metagenome TaxID=1076179 RepID=A0A644ZRY4_9ZZZZ